MELDWELLRRNLNIILQYEGEYFRVAELEGNPVPLRDEKIHAIVASEAIYRYFIDHQMIDEEGKYGVTYDYLTSYANACEGAHELLEACNFEQVGVREVDGITYLNIHAIGLRDAFEEALRLIGAFDLKYPARYPIIEQWEFTEISVSNLDISITRIIKEHEGIGRTFKKEAWQVVTWSQTGGSGWTPPDVVDTDQGSFDTLLQAFIRVGELYIAQKLEHELTIPGGFNEEEPEM